MQIYFHSRLWSYLPRVPILVEGTVYIYIYIYIYTYSGYGKYFPKAKVKVKFFTLCYIAAIC